MALPEHKQIEQFPEQSPPVPPIRQQAIKPFLRPGLVIRELYQIEKCIATGSMADVYLCSHLDITDRKFALKVLRPQQGDDLNKDPYTLQRFKREVRIFFKICHPNIVHIYEFLCGRDCYAFVMEFVQGGDLADYLQTHSHRPLEWVLRILLQSCSAIHACHKMGIVHRDLKPENLLLTPEGNIKITDFGIAHIINNPRLTTNGCVMGTVQYLSPEYLVEGKCDARSDIYALGVIAYEMLSGKLPFDGATFLEAVEKKVSGKLPPLNHLRAKCPPELLQILRRALQNKPEQRYQNISEMKHDLLRVYRMLQL